MLYRTGCILTGYLCGCFLTAEAVSRHAAGKSASRLGTGNPGMANIMAQLGFKWGLLVLAGDLLKTLFPCMLCRFLLFPRLGGMLFSMRASVWQQGIIFLSGTVSAAGRALP